MTTDDGHDQMVDDDENDDFVQWQHINCGRTKGMKQKPRGHWGTEGDLSVQDTGLAP